MSGNICNMDLVIFVLSFFCIWVFTTLWGVSSVLQQNIWIFRHCSPTFLGVQSTLSEVRGKQERDKAIETLIMATNSANKQKR